MEIIQSFWWKSIHPQKLSSDTLATRVYIRTNASEDISYESIALGFYGVNSPIEAGPFSKLATNPTYLEALISTK